MTPARAMAQRLRSYRIIEEDSDPSFATDIAEAAALLESMADAQEWRPIETAPKGRKLTLGYRNKLDNWRTIMGCYYSAGTLDGDDCDDADEDGFAPEGWYEVVENGSPITYTDEPPTHWRPLPSPPQAEGAGT